MLIDTVLNFFTSKVAAALMLCVALLVASNAITARLLLRSHENHAAYVATVIAERNASEVAAAKQAARDLKAKERADEENRRTTERLRASVEQLRRERDRLAGGFLPPAPPTPQCPDGKVCLDRAEYLAAHGKLVAGVRGLSDEGTQAVTDLDTATVWAK